LRRDVVAGIVLTTLLEPQGMAYAELAGLPAITALYTTILCLVGYAVFGPSRILVLGPDSSLGPMIAATILPILGSNGSPERAIALASMLALIVGAIMIAAGALKLGFVAAIAASAVFDLSGHGVSLVGTLPKGFPPLTVPSPISDLPLLVAGALGIALVALTDTISTASSFAARTGQEANGNGEMIGIGAANVAAGFFQGFPVSTSGSRPAVAEQAGAKTQLTGVVGAALIVLMLVLVPGLLKNLPNPTLAAVVIAASLSLADLSGTLRLWRQRRVEFLLSITAFLGVALLGVLQGIAVAVALSILNVFRRAWWP
jgi:MFS superfamily sulfate permease-like transporter